MYNGVNFDFGRSTSFRISPFAIAARTSAGTGRSGQETPSLGGGIEVAAGRRDPIFVYNSNRRPIKLTSDWE